jgi:hypothetical protein
VETVPVSGRGPLQAPPAAQLVALVETQEMLVELPLGRVLAPALMLTVGGGWVTVTVVDWLALPPAPVQARV